jgi:hypothetical protein
MIVSLKFNPLTDIRLIGQGVGVAFLGGGRTVIGVDMDDDMTTYRHETQFAPPADDALEVPVGLNEMDDDEVEELIERAVWQPVTYAMREE